MRRLLWRPPLSPRRSRSLPRSLEENATTQVAKAFKMSFNYTRVLLHTIRTFAQTWLCEKMDLLTTTHHPVTFPLASPLRPKSNGVLSLPDSQSFLLRVDRIHSFISDPCTRRSLAVSLHNTDVRGLTPVEMS